MRYQPGGSLYELTAANVAEARLSRELLEEANLGESLARRLFGDLAYRSGKLEEELLEAGVLLVTERSQQEGGKKRQQVQLALSSLKRVLGIGETLAKTLLVGLATRIAAKICAYTYALQINRRLGRSQGAIKDLWA